MMAKPTIKQLPLGNRSDALPLRIRWAVDLLAARSSDRILEIGCGGGHAVKLICEETKAGSIAAIDRSAMAIARATALNAHAIKAKRASFHVVDLVNAAFPDASFDMAFAINVNLFWTGGDREIAILRRALAPNGRLLLVYEPPSAAQSQSIIRKTSAALQRNGFLIEAPAITSDASARMVALRAAPAGDQAMADEKPAPDTEFPHAIGRVAARELAAHGYTRLAHLTKVSAAELLKIHGVGPKSIRILREELARRRKSFAGES